MMPYKSAFGPFLPTRHSKWIFMGTVVATTGVLSWRRGLFNSGPAPERRTNRIYMPVRYESEFEPLLILKPPLLANFSVRNDPKSNQLTGALYRIVSDETEKSVSVVDVEADEPGVRELLTRYQVNSIPTIVALRGGNPISKYTPGDTEKDGEGLDWLKLKEWIESVADEKK